MLQGLESGSQVGIGQIQEELSAVEKKIEDEQAQRNNSDELGEAVNEQTGDNGETGPNERGREDVELANEGKVDEQPSKSPARGFISQGFEKQENNETGPNERAREDLELANEGRIDEQPSKSPEMGGLEKQENNETGRAREDLELANQGRIDEQPSKSPEGAFITEPGSQRFESSLPRNLSSPDRAIREKALTLLGEWLASCKQVEEAQLLEIWKSLLFLVWHTTKGPAQAELTRSITLILWRFTPELALVNLRVFLATMVKEWSGIDKKRIEKFHSLLHLCLRHAFTLLELQEWNEELTRKFVDAVGSTEGVNVFLLQAYLQELRSFVPPTPEILRLLLEPFFVLSVKCSSKVVLQKIRDAVFLPLLQEARAALRIPQPGDGGRGGGGGEEKRSLGSMVLALSMGSKFSELSASPSVAPNNKKLLQQLYEEFAKSEKPLPGLRPLLKKPKAREEEAAISSSSPESMTGRKRKRVNAGDAPVEHRRVLRSERKSLALQQQQGDYWDPEVDPVVLNLEEKLTLLGDSRSDDEGKYETSEKTTTTTTTSSANEEESEAEQQGNAAKRVRFSLRNNIVWAPHKPMPPQWVRVPPCAAPRGSAMKAGVLPGPIAEASAAAASSSPKKSKKEKKKKKKKAKGGKRKKSATPPRSKRLKTGEADASAEVIAAA